MKNNVSKVLIGIALMFTAGAAYSEPVEHTFSTTGPSFIDPLLTGLTSVSGTFTYENGVAPFGTVGAGGGAPEGSTIYIALSNLSGNANGNSFSDSLGSIIVGDDKFFFISPPSRDIVWVNWEPPGDATLSGFSFAGMPLVNVTFLWLEDQPGIFFDFLEDQSLPAVLPPTVSGELLLRFVDEAGVFHAANFFVTVVPVIPANSDIFFSGPLAIVDIDLGGGVYSGAGLGTNFFGAINRLTSDGFISDGTKLTSLSCCVTTPHHGVEVSNDFVLDAEDAAFLTALGGTGFVAGDIIDLIEIEGDTTAGGGLLFVGLVYVLDPLAFDDESRNNFPPDPNDILIQLFFIGEEADRGLTISFDTFDNLGSDAIAIDVHVNGTLVGRNLTNPFTDGLFVPVSVGFDADGTLDLTFDGNPIFVDLPTGFTPQSTNRFGFGGRTGAGNAVQRIDNVSISACMDTFGCPPPDAEYVNNFGSSVGPASLFGDAILDSGSVRLTDSINFQLGSLVINDLVPGGAVASFAATFDLQMGPSSGTPGPADGISFNLGPLPDEAFGEEGAGGVDIYDAVGVVDSESDSDGDGIEDAIDGTFNGVFNDQSAVFSDDFTDQHLGGSTFGAIVDRSNHSVAVFDHSTLGAILTATGGPGAAEVQMCTSPGVTIFLTSGDQFIATCGSFTGETLVGPVIVTVGTITITIPAGAIALLEELPRTGLSITSVGDGSIEIDDGEVVTILEFGDSPLIIPDEDNDGVPNDDDVCPATVIPEAAPTSSKGLNPNHWALTDGDFQFDTVTKGKGNGPGRSYTTSDTAGCSCEQLIDAQGLGNGHTKNGCSIGAMDNWLELVNNP